MCSWWTSKRWRLGITGACMTAILLLYAWMYVNIHGYRPRFDELDHCLLTTPSYQSNEYNASHLANLFKPVNHTISDKRLPRGLTHTQYTDSIRFLTSVNQLFTEYNITWTLAFGTLLGCVVSHDILPWDDDLDCWMLKSDMNKIDHLHKTKILAKKYGLGYIPKEKKLFDLSKPLIKPYTWSYPFIDFTQIEISDNHVIHTDWRKPAHSYKVDIGRFFPLEMRPFGGMWFPVPRDSWGILNLLYKPLSCQMSSWNHPREQRRQNPPRAHCADLMSVYPHVYRTHKDGITTETLYVGNTALYNICFDGQEKDTEFPNSFWAHG